MSDTFSIILIGLPVISVPLLLNGGCIALTVNSIAAWKTENRFLFWLSVALLILLLVPTGGVDWFIFQLLTGRVHFPC